MSVEVDYIQIMRNALNNFCAWEECLEKLRSSIKDSCADAALKIALEGLNKTSTWLSNCILWEKEAQREMKIQRNGGEV